MAARTGERAEQTGDFLDRQPGAAGREAVCVADLRRVYQDADEELHDRLSS